MKKSRRILKSVRCTIAAVLCITVFIMNYNNILAIGLNNNLEREEVSGLSQEVSGSSQEVNGLSQEVSESSQEVSESSQEADIFQADPEVSQEELSLSEPLYDEQPIDIEAVQAAITLFESTGQKPRWQYEVPVQWLPKGYTCRYVEAEEDLEDAYYTIFMAPSTLGFGDGNYMVEPPPGIDISSVFNFVGDTQLDSQYSNVAIVTTDNQNQYGAIWAKDQLDLSLPFETDMFLHLAHKDGTPAGQDIADGMTFIMHNDAEALTKMVAAPGEGLGVYKARGVGRPIDNSFIIEFDTYDNGGVVDPAPPAKKYAHVAWVTEKYLGESYKNNHNDTYFFLPEQRWYEFTVKWEPLDHGTYISGILTYSFDGRTSTVQIADTKTIFGDNTHIYWGFTGATGGSTALQAAAVKRLPVQDMQVRKSVADTNGNNLDGKTVGVGQILRYTIRATAGEVGRSGFRSLVVTDALSDYLDYDREPGGNLTATLSKNGSPLASVTGTITDGTVTFTLPGDISLLENDDWIEISFDLAVKADGMGKSILNTAAVGAVHEEESEYLSNTTKVNVSNGSQKFVSEDSAAGKNNTYVTVGDIITYEIVYINTNSTRAALDIEEILPVGLELIAVIDEENPGVNTLPIATRYLENGESGRLFVTARVTDEVNRDIPLVNQAVLTWTAGNNASKEKVMASNPVKAAYVHYYGNSGVLESGASAVTIGLLGVRDPHTVQDGIFVLEGYYFDSWNTRPDGSGTTYFPGDGIGLTELETDVELYARWNEIPSFRFYKEAPEGTPLEDTEFELYSCSAESISHIHTKPDEEDTCWQYHDTASSDAAGLVVFERLEPKQYYLLLETKAQAGYRLPEGYWILFVSEGGKVASITGVAQNSSLPPAFYIGSEEEYRLKNYRSLTMPDTGGMGSILSLSAGIVLLGTAVGVAIPGKRKIK